MKSKLLLLTPIALLLTLGACTSSISPFTSGDKPVDSKYQEIFKAGNNIKLLKKTPVVEQISKHEIGEEGYRNFLDDYRSFSSSLTEDYFKCYGNDHGKNTAISPLSIYFAMAQAGCCANNNTQKEIFDALNMTTEEANKYSNYLFRQCNEVFVNYNNEEEITGRLELNNSLWFDKQLILIDEGLEKLANSYYCEPYGADFKNHPEDVSKRFNDYLTDKTRGLIKPNFEFDKETAMVIANTLYMKDIWNIFGNDLALSDEKDFKNSDGTTTNKRFMYSPYCLGRVHEEEDFFTFYTGTCHSFMLKFIVPKEGKTIDEVFTSENLLKAHNAKYETDFEEDGKYAGSYYTRCIFPEFIAEANDSLVNLFKNRGVNDFFEKCRCDFSNVTKDIVYCSDITHIAKLKVEPKGIEGAAVTVVNVAGATSIDEKHYIYEDFIIDRSFGFELCNGSNIPLFTGIVNKI